MLRVAAREGGESDEFNVVIPPKRIGQYLPGAQRAGIVLSMLIHPRDNGIVMVVKSSGSSIPATGTKAKRIDRWQHCRHRIPDASQVGMDACVRAIKTRPGRG